MRTPETTDDATVLNLLSELRQSESDFDNQTDTVQPIVDDTTLPAQIELSRPRLDRSTVRVSTDAQTEVVVEISNTGGQRAEGIGLTATVPDPVSVSPESLNLGDIAPDETVTETLDLAASGEGRVVLSVTANGDNVSNDSIQQPVIAESGDEGIDLARFDQNDNGQIDLNEVLAAITAFNTGGTVAGEAVTLDQVLQVITAFNTGESI